MMNRGYSLMAVVCAVLLALANSQSAAQQPAPKKMPDNVELLRSVPFGKGGNQTLTMHILRPKVLPKDPMPVLVYIHGSAWGRDNKDMAIARLIATAQQGYFGATIQVRTSGEAVFPAQIEDAKCAIRFLRQGQGVSPGHRSHRRLGRVIGRAPGLTRRDHRRRQGV